MIDSVAKFSIGANPQQKKINHNLASRDDLDNSNASFNDQVDLTGNGVVSEPKLTLVEKEEGKREQPAAGVSFEDHLQGLLAGDGSSNSVVSPTVLVQMPEVEKPVSGIAIPPNLPPIAQLDLQANKKLFEEVGAQELDAKEGFSGWRAFVKGGTTEEPFFYATTEGSEHVRMTIKEDSLLKHFPPQLKPLAEGDFGQNLETIVSSVRSLKGDGSRLDRLILQAGSYRDEGNNESSGSSIEYRISTDKGDIKVLQEHGGRLRPGWNIPSAVEVKGAFVPGLDAFTPEAQENLGKAGRELLKWGGSALQGTEQQFTSIDLRNFRLSDGYLSSSFDFKTSSGARARLHFLDSKEEQEASLAMLRFEPGDAKKVLAEAVKVAYNLGHKSITVSPTDETTVQDYVKMGALPSSRDEKSLKSTCRRIQFDSQRWDISNLTAQRVRDTFKDGELDEAGFRELAVSQETFNSGEERTLGEVICSYFEGWEGLEISLDDRQGMSRLFSS